MNQQRLFGEPVPDVRATRTFELSHARSTDPSTSSRAAEHVAYKVGSYKARLLAVYRANPDGLTDDEAGLLAGLPAGAWKRCSDLRNEGAIEPVGEKMGRNRTPVMVCAATTEREDR